MILPDVALTIAGPHWLPKEYQHSFRNLLETDYGVGIIYFIGLIDTIKFSGGQEKQEQVVLVGTKAIYWCSVLAAVHYSILIDTIQEIFRLPGDTVVLRSASSDAIFHMKSTDQSHYASGTRATVGHFIQCVQELFKYHDSLQTGGAGKREIPPVRFSSQDVHELAPKLNLRLNPEYKDEVFPIYISPYASLIHNRCAKELFENLTTEHQLAVRALYSNLEGTTDPRMDSVIPVQDSHGRNENQSIAPFQFSGNGKQPVLKTFHSKWRWDWSTAGHPHEVGCKMHGYPLPIPVVNPQDSPMPAIMLHTFHNNHQPPPATEWFSANVQPA